VSTGRLAESEAGAEDTDPVLANPAMSKSQAYTQDGSDLPTPLRQDTTRQTILCLDSEGYHHVYCENRQRVVVLNASGIDHTEDLGQYDDLTISDWIAYVADKRGIAKIQKYTGEMLFGDLWGCKL